GRRNAGHMLHQGVLCMRGEHVEKVSAPSPTRLARPLRGAEVEKSSCLRVEEGVICLYLPAPNLHPQVLVAPLPGRTQFTLEAARCEPAVEHPLTLALLVSDAYPRALLALLNSANFTLQKFDVGECGKPVARIPVEIAA